MNQGNIRHSTTISASVLSDRRAFAQSPDNEPRKTLNINLCGFIAGRTIPDNEPRKYKVSHRRQSTTISVSLKQVGGGRSPKVLNMNQGNIRHSTTISGSLKQVGQVMTMSQENIRHSTTFSVSSKQVGGCALKVLTMSQENIRHSTTISVKGVRPKS
jgi:hypothetical protein